jgi:hypothetical protein
LHAIIGRAGENFDASFEWVELDDALLPADTHHLITPVQRVLHHVPAELSRGAHYAYFLGIHSSPPKQLD